MKKTCVICTGVVRLGSPATIALSVLRANEATCKLTAWDILIPVRVTVQPKYFEGENFHGFTNNLENFNLENFVLHYNSILCFCNPRNIYHKNTESHESTKILTFEIFRLYGTCYMVCIN